MFALVGVLFDMLGFFNVMMFGGFVVDVFDWLDCFD